jgi:hypothetical protein
MILPCRLCCRCIYGRRNRGRKGCVVQLTPRIPFCRKDLQSKSPRTRWKPARAKLYVLFDNHMGYSRDDLRFVGWWAKRTGFIISLKEGESQLSPEIFTGEAEGSAEVTQKAQPGRPCSAKKGIDKRRLNLYTGIQSKTVFFSLLAPASLQSNIRPVHR